MSKNIHNYHCYLTRSKYFQSFEKFSYLFYFIFIYFLFFIFYFLFLFIFYFLFFILYLFFEIKRFYCINKFFWSLLFCSSEFSVTIKQSFSLVDIKALEELVETLKPDFQTDCKTMFLTCIIFIL